MSSYIGEIRIGKDYQAALPLYLGPYPTSGTEGEVNGEQQQQQENHVNNDADNCENLPPTALQEHGADLVWNPKSITDDNLIMFLRAARSVTAFAGMCRKKGPNKEDGASVISRDQTTQRYFDILHENEYDVNQTLDILGKEPLPKMWEKEWTHDEAKCFSRAIKIIGKEFNRVRDEYLKHKRIKDLIQFYYFWKKSPYNPSRNQRRNRRNRKNTNPNNTGSSNNNNSKSGSNSKSNTTRLPNLTDQTKMEDGTVSSTKPLESLNADPSLPPTTTGASSPGRSNGQLTDPAKSSAPTTAATEDDDNLFDNDDIPLLNLVKVARGLAVAGGPVTTQSSNNATTSLALEPSKDKSCSSGAKETSPKEVFENEKTAPGDIKMADLTMGEAGISIDHILPEAIVLDEGIAAPRITLTSTSSNCNLGPNNHLYEIPLSDIGIIKSEIIPVLSEPEGPEKTKNDLTKSPPPLIIVATTSVNLSTSTLKCLTTSPVLHRTSTPESAFVPVRSSVVVPTPPALIKNLKPDLKRDDHTPPIPERSVSSSPEISESEMATTNAQAETDQWLGEKLFRNGNMYRYIKRVDGSSCARTDLAFVFQKLPFHYPTDLELSRVNDPDPINVSTGPNITTSPAATFSTSPTSTTGGPFAAAAAAGGKMNRGGNCKAPTASILPMPCPPKSRSPITAPAGNKSLHFRHEDEMDRTGLAGPTFPHPSAPSGFWYPPGAGQQPFLFTPPPLHLAQAALLPYFMAAASGAFAPPFPLPHPLAPPNYEPPETLSAAKASTPNFGKGAVGRHDHQQQRPQELLGQECTSRSSAVKNGYNQLGIKALSSSPSPLRGGPLPTLEPSSPYYAYLSAQQQQQHRALKQTNAMGLIKGVASPPHHPHPPPSRPNKSTPKGTAPFTPWATRPAPHPGIYEYPPPASVKRKSGGAQDLTLERKKTPALEAKSNPRKHTAPYLAKFPGPYNELAFTPQPLGIGSNQESSVHPFLPTHHPSLTNGAGQSGKTPPVNKSKISTNATMGNAPPLTSMPLDPFYHHHRAPHQQHFQAAGASQARPPPGPFEFNPFFPGPNPNMVSSTGPGPNHPYHLSHQNFHPSLMRGFRGTNFNPFPTIPEEIMAAAAAQHQYQLLQQHSYFSNPFSPNVLPSMLQQQDRNDIKRE